MRVNAFVTWRERKALVNGWRIPGLHKDQVLIGSDTIKWQDRCGGELIHRATVQGTGLDTSPRKSVAQA